MTVRVPSFALALLVTTALGLSAYIGFGAPASAQTQAPRTAVCQSQGMTGISDKKVEQWMNEQIAAGRTDFITAGTVFCAW